ncbi:Cell surface glycoprotein MUC18, partial [Eurypyga helias]
AHVPSGAFMGWQRRCVREPSHGERLDASQKDEVTVQDARTFVCQVEAGSHGVHENRTQLQVYKVPEAPEIKANQGGISVQSTGVSEIAQCISKNGFPPPNITWHKNGEQLEPEEKVVKIPATLTRESSGLYTVSSALLAHVTREDRNSVYHYPAQHVKLKVMPSAALVKEGDDVKLVCEADGNPAPVFSFYKRELENSWQDLTSLADTNSGVLNLHGVNKSSSGLYRCQTLDLDDMEQLEKDVELFVNWKPRIVAISSPLYVRQDEVVNLTCKAIAFPRPSVQWNINGTAHEYVENQHVASNLTVRVNHDLLRAGAMCRVSNALGVSEKHIQLLDQQTTESKGVIIVAIIVCILVVAVLGSVIYFLHKKGKIPCGRAGKQDM